MNLPQPGASGARLAMLLCALGLAGPASAHADGISIGPARIDQAVGAGSLIGPVTLRNSSPRRVAVDVVPQTITQARSGLAQIDATPAGHAAAVRLIAPSRRHLVLPPHTTRQVSARVLARPPHGITAYAALAFRARGVSASRASISPAVQLSTNLLLRFRGTPHIAGHTSALRAEQGGGGTLMLIPTVANTGNLHAKPHGRVSVTDAAGRTVVRRRLPAANVLPGAEREFAIPVRDVLRAGRYAVRADVTFGGRRTRREMPFRLIAPNTLPTARVRLAALDAPKVAPGHAFHEAVHVRNTGTATAAAVLRYRLREPGAGATVRRGTVVLPKLRPGAHADPDLALPGLRQGAYDLTASVTLGGREVAHSAVQFTPRAQPAAWDRARDWLSGHSASVIGGAALVLMGIVAALLAYIVRLRSRATA
jgi:hypothetical protein